MTFIEIQGDRVATSHQETKKKIARSNDLEVANQNRGAGQITSYYIMHYVMHFVLHAQLMDTVGNTMELPPYRP